MKKILLILTIFFINIPIVLAESSAYLSSLEIEGYTLSPEFDKYNNSYSVTINEEDTSLKINYVLEDENSEIKILDNDLITEDDSTVTINVTNNEEQQIYKIYVTKDKDETIANIDNDLTELNITKKFNKKHVISAISICWLIIVLLFRWILFGHKRKS